MLLPARETTFANEPTWVSNHPFRSYSYIIQVSVDNENWDTIISGHSEPIINLPTSMPTIWQIWYFKPVIAKFIRIIDGELDNRDNNWFYLLSFECYYSSKSFEFDQNGVIIPHFNIASIPFQPQFCCQEMTEITPHFNTPPIPFQPKFCCQEMTFLSDCDLDTKYKTYLMLMSNSYCPGQQITIKLQQQCVIDSIKFLLYDQDTKSYRYYVELSPDGCDKNFRVVIKRNNDWYTSWQLIKFTSQVVKSVRIYCTSKKTAYSMNYTRFRLVHFECPASDFIESSNDS
ncbi:BTB/POZ domain-containing protein 9-like protein [Dinothrombium tinctorium]|uniref:BTB/POZ domain-containing protein 9-like protein n=1 Tax=Dinothrombium tinctorium TaxID=1965070 RepID=A0A443Q6U8_9ACAR|nr:BTB/POZ domain-containing protein 9-like protein [Dinothrombium tinctorium]